MIFTGKGFHDANTIQILLNNRIQTVIRLKHPLKNRMHFHDNRIKANTENRHSDHIN